MVIVKKWIFYIVLLFALLLVLIPQSVKAQMSTDSDLIPVEVGIRIHQIVAVDAKKKNFTAVLSVKAKWKDPILAYDANIHPPIRTLNKETLKALSIEKDAILPSSIISNAQGKVQSQNNIVTISADGEVNYLERFTIVLQANNFNFKKFPFDSQLFEIHLDTLTPNGNFSFTELEGFSVIESTTGVDEWEITSVSTNISTLTGFSSAEKSRFTLAFEAKRQFVYYILKIFIPVSLIIIVSWFTFFLSDYAKRIDLAGSNLLVFIAFNFTISNELPKLGYITFLDALLVSTFLITTLVILLNVLLRNLENNGRTKYAEAIDSYVLWAYPLVYLFGLLFTIMYIF
jgi:hypothetical protein